MLELRDFESEIKDLEGLISIGLPEAPQKEAESRPYNFSSPSQYKKLPSEREMAYGFRLATNLWRSMEDTPANEVNEVLNYLGFEVPVPECVMMPPVLGNDWKANAINTLLKIRGYKIELSEMTPETRRASLHDWRNRKKSDELNLALAKAREQASEEFAYGASRKQ